MKDPIKDPNKEPIKDPIKGPSKDTLVPLRTNFNANGSVRWRTSLYLNLFHWPMGKNSGNGNGVCRYVRARCWRNVDALLPRGFQGNMNY